MRIREATVDDIPELIELCRKMHAESKYTGIPFEDAYVQRALHRSISDWGETMYVAELSNDVIVGFVGMMLIQYHFSPKLMATDTGMYIMPEYRHTSAFARLLQSAEKWGITEGASSILFSLTAAPDTEKAMRAYCKMGYAQWGVTLRKEL